MKTSPHGPSRAASAHRSIKHMHCCEAIYLESVPVRETLQGKIVWDGEVQVFSLAGHPVASKCYAWSHLTTGTKRRFVAVLHLASVDSHGAAVRASVVSESREPA
jgi:hypothetical protein